MSQFSDSEADKRSRSAHLIGWFLAIATVLSLAMIAHHPMVRADRGQDVLAGIVLIRQMNHIIHGGLIILIGLFALSFTYFARRLGLSRVPVLAGVMLYNLGGGLVIGAALIDGFITSDLAERYVATTIEDSRIGFNLLVFCGFAIQSLTKLGLISMSAAICCWSAVLVQKRRFLRVTGTIGIAAGILPIALLLGTKPILEPPTLLGIMAIQSLWNLAVAIVLISHSESLIGVD